jgi:hypothetical protein
MYTQAFVSDDIGFVVREALKAIPAQSRFYLTIADVIRWHERYPDDWKQNWFNLQKKWTAEKGCPDGVFRAFNIDASINAAYIVLGLLTARVISGRPWISAQGQGMTPTATLRMLPASWVPCLATVIYPITGNRDWTGWRTAISFIPICRCWMYMIQGMATLCK